MTTEVIFYLPPLPRAVCGSLRLASRARQTREVSFGRAARTFLHGSPALCLFLSILLGTIIGRFHFKGVGFGAVVGTLIAGIAIGIFAKPELPELLRWAFFYLFLFAIGYSVGPQFFGSLKKEALPQIVLALVVAVTGLATVVGVRGALRLRRRHRRRPAVGRHDAVGGARHGPQRDRRAADRRRPRRPRSWPTRRWPTRSPTASATWA